LKIKKYEILLALLSGALTAFSLPKFNFSFFAWISIIPLIFIIRNKTPKQSFLLGLIAGISYNAILIYWVPSVPAHYGNMSLVISLIIYVLFILFLALYWAFFCLVWTKIYLSFPKLIFLLSPFIWISFEYILTHFLTGFPWGLSAQASTQIFTLSSLLLLPESMVFPLLLFSFKACLFTP